MAVNTLAAPLLVLLLAAAVPAAADTDLHGCDVAGAPQVLAAQDDTCQPIGGHGDCSNHGVIAQVGASNGYACSTWDKGEDCSNDGVIVQAGWGNRYACTAEPDGGCRNDGAVIMAGPQNTYECAGHCGGAGIVVNVGGSYCGSGPVYACMGEYGLHVCTDVPLVAAAPAPEVVLTPHPVA